MSKAPQQQLHELRACEMCTHCQRQGPDLLCTEPAVAGALQRVPCQLARYGTIGQPGGCGRDARHLHWPALDVPSRTQPLELWAQAA